MNNIKFNIGDIVILPFNETGEIMSINNKTLDWFPYKIKIRKAIFNKTNQLLEFKEEQLKLKQQ